MELDDQINNDVRFSQVSSYIIQKRWLNLKSGKEKEIWKIQEQADEQKTKLLKLTFDFILRPNANLLLLVFDIQSSRRRYEVCLNQYNRWRVVIDDAFSSG